jgi:hypothetical protein
LSSEQSTDGFMERPTLARSVVGIALAVLTAQACGDGTGPGRFTGSYDLRRYEGVPIPVITSQSDAGSVSIVAQRIVLGDDGKGGMSTTIRVVNAVTPQGALTGYSQALTYVGLGAKIAITFICPPNADCLAGPHLVGERNGDDLTVARPQSSKPASVYSRVR